MTATKNTELLNCPFCGNQPEQHQNSHSGYWFTCDNDDCAFNLVRKSRKDAVDDWNKRAKTDRGQAGEVDTKIKFDLCCSCQFDGSDTLISQCMFHKNQTRRLKEAVRDLASCNVQWSDSYQVANDLHSACSKHYETIKEAGE